MSNDQEQTPDEMPETTPETLADIGEAASTDGAAPADLAAARIKTLEAEVLDAKDKMMRALADAENTRRRSVKDREDIAKYAISGFAKDLLDFSDNFHRALASIPKELHDDERINGIVTGLEAMEAQLLKTFEKNGIRKIEPLDEPFNPNFHEVMFEAPTPGKPAGIVIQVIEAGFLLNDRLLRAAKVGISKGGMGSDHQVDQKA
jgi:molecular chaperone GrpE